MAFSSQSTQAGHGEDTTNTSSISVQTSQPLEPSTVHRTDDQQPDRDDRLLIQSDQVHRSPSAVGSAVDDVGDSLQLQDVAKKRLSRNGESAVDYSGTHRPLAENSERQNSISGALDDEPLDALQLLIRGYMLAAAYSPTSFFLPLSELDSLISIPNIQKELKRSGLTSEVEQIGRQVWSPQKLPTGKFTTRRRIFAILCLIDKAASIQEFIAEDIYDSDLPFEFEPTRVLRRSGILIRLFMQWEIHCRDIFYDYQGRFLAPYFKFTALHFREYKLHRCVVLPFMEYEVGDKRISPILTHFSEVRRVIIHLAHHDYCMTSGKSEKVLFAVKRLQQVEATEQSTTWNREIEAYKRLNSIHHQHIVRLLATYLQDEKLHMIFPWADGNLFQFWKERFPDRSYPPRDPKLARWMLKQFVGLAEALLSIHNYKIGSAVDDMQIEDRKRTHGRHGDIKPENILCFTSTASDSQEDILGTLMISDLGSTEFHGTLSKVVGAHAAGGFTETYKAPEFDFMEQVSPESDIWSFGCVLFQFIVWYMLGWSGVEAFAQARTEDSNFLIRMDHFFNFFKHENSVEAKASVRKEFQKLRDGTNTSDFILALLDVLENDMLRLRFEQRASCDEIVRQLRDIKNLCDRDPAYCTERTRKFDFKARVPTGLSEKVSVPLSEEMRAEYIRNIDPNLHLVNTQSVKQRSARSVGDDSERRDTRSFTRHISFRSTQPSTSAAGRQELQVDTSGVSPGRGQGEQHPNILRRALTRIKDIITGCLPRKGNR